MFICGRWWIEQAGKIVFFRSTVPKAGSCFNFICAVVTVYFVAVIVI